MKFCSSSSTKFVFVNTPSKNRKRILSHVSSTYILAEGTDKEEKSAFYDDPGRVYQLVPDYDVKIILADSNAKVSQK